MVKIVGGSLYRELLEGAMYQDVPVMKNKRKLW